MTRVLLYFAYHYISSIQKFFFLVFGSFLSLVKVSRSVPEKIMSRSVFGQFYFVSFFVRYELN